MTRILAEHLRYHSGKIRGIVNGIDTDNWNPATDKLLAANYDAETAIANKKLIKRHFKSHWDLMWMTIRL